MRLQSLYPKLWLVAFLLPTAAFAYIGHFSRYIADDYCTTAVALSQGLFGSIRQWYTTWAGQYTNWLLKGIVAHLGTGFPGVIPLIVLLLWSCATIWMLTQIIAALGLTPNRIVTWVLSAMAVYAVFAGIPSVIQSLYWFGASIPYTLPLAALIFYIGFFIRTLRQTPADRLSVLSMVLVFALTLFAGGTSEVFGAFQIAVIGLMLLASMSKLPARLKPVAIGLSVAALLGAVAALVLIVSAPGNAIRQAQFTEHLSLVQIGIQTILASASYFVLAIGVFSPVPLLVCVVVPAIILPSILPPNSPTIVRPKHARRLLAISAGIAFILMMACFAPSIYAVSSTPPARVYIFPQLVLVGMACSWGFIIGLSLKRRQPPKRLAMVMLAVLLIVGPLWTTIRTLADAPLFNTYASEWDARDAAIRAAVSQGEQYIRVAMLSVDMGAMAALEPIGADPQGGVNQCAAQYYGVQSITAESLIQMADKSS